jgi:hypothetical protein
MVLPEYDCLWNVVLCCLVEIYGHLRGAYCLQHQGLEISINFYKSTRCNIL